MSEEQRIALSKCIGNMLLPLVAPYDLSEKQLVIQHQNNIHFRRACDQVFHLITSEPLTLEKVLNDMKIMKDLGI